MNRCSWATPRRSFLACCVCISSRPYAHDGRGEAAENSCRFWTGTRLAECGRVQEGNAESGLRRNPPVAHSGYITVSQLHGKVATSLSASCKRAQGRGVLLEALGGGGGGGRAEGGGAGASRLRWRETDGAALRAVAYGGCGLYVSPHLALAVHAQAQLFDAQAQL